MPLDLTRTLDVPELTAVGLSLTLADLTRHVFVTGASGSGKTSSIAVPLIRAVLRLRETLPASQRPALIVIDPKKELGGTLHALVPRDELLQIGRPDDRPIDLYASIPRRPHDIGVMADQLIAIAGAEWSTNRDVFWTTSSRAVLRDLLQLDAVGTEDGASAQLAQRRRAHLWRDVARAARQYAGYSEAQCRRLLRIRRPLARYLRLLDLLQRDSPAAPQFDRLVDELTNIFERHAPAAELSALRRLPTLATETGTSLVASVAAQLGCLTADGVQLVVSFDPLPPGRPSGRLDLGQAIRGGHVVLFQPDTEGEEAAAIGRAIKVAYYGAVVGGAALSADRQAVERLAVLVADEYQTVMSLSLTGVNDARFLDRARAYGGAAVLICQSTSALLERVPEGNRSAVRALLTNMGTKCYFASSDPVSVEELRSVIVGPPIAHLPHLLDVRPPSTFPPGKMAWLSAGRFGLGTVPLPFTRPSPTPNHEAEVNRPGIRGDSVS